MTDATRLSAAIAAAAKAYDMPPALVREVVTRYLQTPDIHRTAARVGLPWPKVHLMIFDFRRAGVLPRRRRAA